MASGTCGGNLRWTLENFTLTIRGKGCMMNYLFEVEAPWHPYPNTIKNLVIECGVTSIGNSAFKGCNNLRSVTIPDSVKSIDDCAFAKCGLTSVAIPDGVTSIGDEAFCGCKNLRKIRIPSSVMTIGKDAFAYCDSLKEIYYPAGSRVAFESNLLFGNNAQLIPYTNKPPVTKPKPQPVINTTPQPVSKPITQPVVEKLRWKVEGKTLTVGGVREIENYSYSATPWNENLRDIQKIIIEEGVEKISANAFAECTRLEQLTIPASVKTIGDGAFTFCYCGDRTINGGRNVIWSLEDGTLMIKKNPAAKNESNFSTGYETWQVIEGNITGVKIERGIVPSKRFFDWLSRMGDGVEVSF